MTFDTPVLLIVWRRPHTTQQVIDAVRKASPTRIFIACDGPNPDRPGEAGKVAATKELIKTAIDWPCELRTLYSDTNQGCRLGVSRAISWFFEEVEEGIILEDDCVPHPDFFPYCAELLNHYRQDERVWCISGDNFQDGQWRGDGSYYFSRYNHCWGWASWRRCWQYYDADLKSWPTLRDSGLLNSIFEDSIERTYWQNIWQRLLLEGKPDSWAYRWTFSCLANGGLTALPNRNLISNIGFGAGATHTTIDSPLTSIDEEIGTLQHPSFILRDTIADRYTFDHHFGGQAIRRSRKLLPRLKAKIRDYLHSF